jgi:hypothetical protein
MTIRHLIQRWVNWVLHPQYCASLQKTLLIAAIFGLSSQILYDQHAIAILALFPQWLFLGSIWYLWRQDVVSQYDWARGTPLFALLIPMLCCLTLLMAWLGWKANPAAICGVIPISDSADYYISAQTFLREAFLDAAGQNRPLNILLAALWLYLSGDNFKLLLSIQAVAFSAAALLGSVVVAALHGFRAGLLLFSLLLVFAGPYLPTMLSETNGAIFGTLSLVGFLFGVHRRSLFSYCFGAFFLAMGLAIRPSALFVLPCVVVAGAMIFGAGRFKTLVLVASLTGVVLVPSGISILLNNTMSHHDGGLNANLSYTVYGLVTGGKGWEQYQKDNPGKLEALPEAERSHVILEASKQRFTERPFDLVRGLITAQVLGPLQTFSQITRVTFFGAASDPLRIISPFAIIVVSLCFAGVLWCKWAARMRVGSSNRDFRLFCVWILIGYLISIPFFYKDGGLRLHAAILPLIFYMFVWVLLPRNAASDNVLLSGNAGRLLVGTTVFGFALLGLLSWISLLRPKGHTFDPLLSFQSSRESTIVFRFEPGWPQCDLRRFEPVPGDSKPRWLSGAIPDFDYLSSGIRAISGRGSLYFGFDATGRKWEIIHVNEPVGLLNKIMLEPGRYNRYRDSRYRDFFWGETVQVIDARVTPDEPFNYRAPGDRQGVGGESPPR